MHFTYSKQIYLIIYLISIYTYLFSYLGEVLAYVPISTRKDVDMAVSAGLFSFFTLQRLTTYI